MSAIHDGIHPPTAACPPARAFAHGMLHDRLPRPYGTDAEQYNNGYYGGDPPYPTHPLTRSVECYSVTRSLQSLDQFNFIMNRYVIVSDEWD